MSLLIAFILLAHFDYEPGAYFATAGLWLLHLAYHHVDLDDIKDAISRKKP